ncbi:hypothetical protein [Mesorhizobium sp. M0478]|uniref:hypothetical protein n=1 Tax=Mesorhizobium sp. M0478 TaxID=2956947 RepID=UPI0033354E2B
MGAYSGETIKQFEEAYEQWVPRQEKLMTAYMVQAYRSEKASEYARHGLSRRLQSLRHGIDRAFEAIPPEAEEPPSRDQLMDATAFIHSFLVSVYGGLDNIARIWCWEAEVKDGKGRPLADGQIGLGPKNTTVRDSLSNNLQDYLKGAAHWFEYLANYRHAVAHRIPVYIPPKTLSNEDGDEWRRIEEELVRAAKAGNFDEYDALFCAQKALGRFEPVVTHSFGENARPVWLHGQMLCDFSTVIEIGEHMLEELNGLDS